MAKTTKHEVEKYVENVFRLLHKKVPKVDYVLLDEDIVKAGFLFGLTVPDKNTLHILTDGSEPLTSFVALHESAHLLTSSEEGGHHTYRFYQVLVALMERFGPSEEDKERRNEWGRLLLADIASNLPDFLRSRLRVF